MARRLCAALAGLVVVLGCAERAGTPGPSHLVLQRDQPPHADALRSALTQANDEYADVLRSFYAARAYAPLFVTRRGVEERAEELIEQMQQAGDDGLDPGAFDLDRLRAAVEWAKQHGADPEALASLELALTHAALHLGRALAVGSTLPRDGGAKWKPPGFSPRALLSVIARDGMADAFEAARPQWPEYARLREALKSYRELEARGGWPIIDKGPVIEPGAEDPRVPILRQRLIATGELKSRDSAEGNTYNERAIEAVKRFQRRHGLEEDGRVGGRTLKALRVPVQERIAQLQINLERWRWTPFRSDTPWVMVNVPAFELSAYDKGERVLRMKVIVGLPDWQTPLFSDRIESLSIHPTWTVPRKILTEEILPKLRDDPGFAEAAGLEVVEKETGTPLAPEEVDWSAVDERAVAYRVRQAPGANNPLGPIKFDLPNRYAIYLHYTDAPRLFEEADRAVSHGCVRVQDPMALADFLLEPTGKEGKTTLRRLIDEGAPKNLALPKPVPVEFVYFTAWKDDDGSIQFRDDVYGHDHRLARALNRERSEQVATSAR